MSDWLDTQTKAILQGVDLPKVAPSLDADFSLVLLERGQKPELHQRALTRILGPEKIETIPYLLEKSCPFVIESSLSHESASLGQFELICADSISVILRDDVASDGDAGYLESLFQSLRKSPEFQVVTVSVLALPGGYRSENFSDQFLGGANILPPLTFPTTRKNARIMQHWARKIGIEVAIFEKN